MEAGAKAGGLPPAAKGSPRGRGGMGGENICGAVAGGAGLRGFKPAWRQRVDDRCRSSIMRRTTPWRVAKCRSGYLELPTLLKTQIFKRVRRSRCVSFRRTVFE